MKHIWSTVLFSFLFFTTFSQVINVQKITETGDSTILVAYWNDFVFPVGNFDDKDILLTSDNGTIESNGMQENKLFSFNITPAHPGITNVHIDLKTANGTKHLKDLRYRTRCMRFDNFTIGHERSGSKLAAAAFREQIGPVAMPDEKAGGTSEIHGKVTKFTFIISRGGKELIKKPILNDAGIRFADDAEMAKLVKNILPGDKVLLQDILVKCPGDGCDWHIKQYELTITQ